MPKFYVETFGCQMNVADSRALAGALSERGYAPADSWNEADLVIVNTCSVREHAEKRATARISEYARRKQPGQNLWVVGCMAERLGPSLKRDIRGVDRVIGATRVESFSNHIEDYLGPCAAPGDEPAALSDGVSTFLPIMRGCDNYCAYCVVPYVRGREHSTSARALVQQAERLAASGVKEITLLGQNVNSYHDGAADFADLLRLVHGVDGIARIRFTTSHPKDCSEKLLRAVAELPKLCKHIHLPVQSGSTRILERMNRRYSRDDYLRLIDTIRSMMADADLTTDVMVGFPGETDADYRQTLSLLRQVRFTAAFMFAFSVRGGTAAANMPDQVADEVKRRRLEEMIGLQTSITKERYASAIGTTARVLFTHRQDGRRRAWMGRDEGCKRVLLHCDHAPAGTILDVKIAGSTGMTLIAERPVQ